MDNRIEFTASDPRERFEPRSREPFGHMFYSIQFQLRRMGFFRGLRTYRYHVNKKRSGNRTPVYEVERFSCSSQKSILFARDVHSIRHLHYE